MRSRVALIRSFRDTQQFIRDNAQLREATQRAMASTTLYLADYEAFTPTVRTEVPRIRVIEDTTFHCAQTLVNGTDKVTVLNFANAYTPGGGVTDGAGAQEECLCRSSNLYPCLNVPYLLKNYYKWNRKNTGDMGTDALIYTAGVTVFKTDDSIPELMQEADWFQTDVITSAAPYYDSLRKKPVTMENLENVFYSRIRNILEVAAANDVDRLVLGAFGCGAFNNPPHLVAEQFQSLLIKRGYGRFFKEVVFAIKGRKEPNTNYEAFREVFAEQLQQ